MIPNEVQKICDVLRGHYSISNNKIIIPDLNLVYEKTISKDGVSVGGVSIAPPDENGNVNLKSFTMLEKERLKGHGTNLLALTFCHPKVIKISGTSLDRSDDFYKEIGINIDKEGNFEINRDEFFENNIHRIRESLKT